MKIFQPFLEVRVKASRQGLCLIHVGQFNALAEAFAPPTPQHEAIHAEPLDELYEALAEVLTAEEPTQCHRSYLLVGDVHPPLHTGQTATSAQR